MGLARYPSISISLPEAEPSVALLDIEEKVSSSVISRPCPVFSCADCVTGLGVVLYLYQLMSKSIIVVSFKSQARNWDQSRFPV